MMRAASLACATAVALLVAGCASGPEMPQPAGGGTDELRRSPCACIEIPQAAPGPADLERYRSADTASPGVLSAAAGEGIAT